MTTATATNGNGQSLATAGERVMQYKPFGSSEAIHLTVRMVKDFVCSKTKSGHVASDETCMKFMMLCKARGLNPFEGDAFLIGYDGQDGPTFSIVTAHQAFLKRAEAHPEYDGMESGVIVRNAQGIIEEKEGDFILDEDFILGGWAKVYRRDRKYPMTKRLRLSTFAKTTPIWKQNPCGMICKCAEADALRASFPNTLAGMYLSEETAPQIVEIQEPTPKAAIPQGRTSLRKKSPETIVEPAPVDVEPESVSSDGRTPVADMPETLQPETDDFPPTSEEIAAGLLERIKAAKTTATLDAIRGEMMKGRAGLGEEYDAVKAEWDTVYRAIKAAGK